MARAPPTARKLDGVEHDVRRPIAPWLPELQPHLTLTGQVEALLEAALEQFAAIAEDLKR